MLASFLATPDVRDLLLETMGLRGCQFYVFMVSHRIWGYCTDGVHFSVDVVIESFVVSDVP